jgi:hypothetical protein
MLLGTAWELTQRGFTMRLHTIWRSAACALLLVAISLPAWPEDDAVQSGWIELVKGAKEATLGAELVEIKAGDTADSQTITVAIPKTAIANPSEIEEVVVLGQRPEKPEKPEPLDITFEWAGDYDADNYGLVIRLRRNTNWPIRLYMNSTPGFIR